MPGGKTPISVEISPLQTPTLQRVRGSLTRAGPAIASTLACISNGTPIAHAFVVSSH